MPLFNAGQLQAAADVARAQRDQYFIAYRSSVLTALEDVENALVALAQERIRIGKLAASAKSYGDAARLEGTLYKAGETSLLDVLDAQRSLYSAEDSLLQSRVLLATNYIALNKALGGGWDGAVDTAKPEVVDVKTGLTARRVVHDAMTKMCNPNHRLSLYSVIEAMRCPASTILHPLGSGVSMKGA